MHLHTPTDLPQTEVGSSPTPFAEERAEMPSPETDIPPTPATSAGDEALVPREDKVYTPTDAAAVAKQFKLIPHNAVKERYKGRFDKADKYDALTAQLALAADRFGISSDDPAALVAALLEATPSAAAAPDEELIAVTEVVPSPSEPPADTPSPVGAQDSHRVRMEAYRRLAQEEAEAREVYPGFDVAEALESPAFRILVGGGLPMKEAYEMSHHAALHAAALEAAREEGRAAALQEREAIDRRPREGAGGYTAPSATDPARLRGKALDAFLESFLTR